MFPRVVDSDGVHKQSTMLEGESLVGGSSGMECARSPSANGHWALTVYAIRALG